MYVILIHNNNIHINIIYNIYTYKYTYLFLSNVKFSNLHVFLKLTYCITIAYQYGRTIVAY